LAKNIWIGEIMHELSTWIFRAEMKDETGEDEEEKEHEEEDAEEEEEEGEDEEE
jgi:hypothetical protein